MLSKEKFEEFLKLNNLNVKIRKNFETEEESSYTLEIYAGSQLIADMNESYVKKGQEYQLDYDWAYDYICDLSYFDKNRLVRIDGTVEVSLLLEKIKKLGVPYITFYCDGCSIDIEPDEVRTTDMDIEFLLNKKVVARISQWVRIKETIRPGTVISGASLAYEVMKGSLKPSGVYLSWPQK